MSDLLGSWKKSARDMVTTVEPLDRRGPKRLWTQGPGLVVRERGDTDGRVTLEFACPVHGRFEALVTRRDTPDEVPCPRVEDCECGTGSCKCCPAHDLDLISHACGLTSPWSPSSVNVWLSAGEVKG